MLDFLRIIEALIVLGVLGFMVGAIAAIVIAAIIEDFRGRRR